MAYITKKKNREGKYYVYLVEGYRVGDKVRQRTLKNYGSLEELEKQEPGAYERLRQEAKAGLLHQSEEKELLVKLQLDRPIAPIRQGYGWKLLDDIFEGLNLTKFLTNAQKQYKVDYDLASITKLLVYQRILHPLSKSATIRSQTELYGQWHNTQNDMDRALDRLNALSQSIQLHLHKEITKQIGREAYLVFYDVTNYFIETDLDDSDIEDEAGNTLQVGLRKRGASKEYRRNPIVQMGLFIDSNGIPISYTLFPGNVTDVKTYLPAIQQVKEAFGLERIITVADKAMNSQHNISETYQAGNGWLFSQKHRGAKGASKELQAFILDPTGWQFNSSKTFAKKSTIRERVLSTKEVVKEKVVVTWNQRYALREKLRREGALEYIDNLSDYRLFRETTKKGGKKYLELSFVDKQTGELVPYSPLVTVNQDKVAFDAQFDGINVLVTSEIEMSDEAIIEAYGQLYKIEDSFRITKTDFESRPMYVRITEHIEAHFLTCFIALVLQRLLQFKTDYQWSCRKLKIALNSAQAHEIGQGYWCVECNEEFKAITKCLNIKHEQLNVFGKGWFTT